MQTRNQQNNAIYACYTVLQQTATAYRPWLVTQVVDGLEGVDARDTTVLQTDDHVAKIFILGHTEGMLTDEDKVWLEGPGKYNYCKNVAKNDQIDDKLLQVATAVLMNMASFACSFVFACVCGCMYACLCASHLTTLVPFLRACMLTMHVPLA